MLLKLFSYKRIFIILLVLVLAIFFETFQQLFYIKRFNLYEDVHFLSLFKNHFYRWIIWFIIGLLLPFFVKKDGTSEITLTIFLKYSIIILCLVTLNVMIISIIEISINNTEFSVSKLFSDYFSFFVFQKAPVYTLGYIAITIILFLNYSKDLLQVEVQELIDIKKENDRKYKELKGSNSDKTKVLNIKVGNKRKIIPIDNITWIEADDYCVIVHSLDLPSYTMRSSLKSLQEKLSDNFLRVHRKGIVNMDMVKELNSSRSPILVLNNNQEVLISKSNLKTVKSFLKR